jgi:hypothetical protein
MFAVKNDVEVILLANIAAIAVGYSAFAVAIPAT